MNKKIAILTSGGDAPGMNTAIIILTKYALAKGMDVYYVIDGYKGLYKNSIVSCKEFDYNQYFNKGGTFIGSARFPEFKEESTRKVAVENLKTRGIDSLIVVGGDGSYQGAQKLHELGVKTMALPGTIDNDITSSDFTIGYPTALQTIMEAIIKVRDTHTSHERAGLIQVMGHGCGDLSLFGGLAGGADLVITNENKMTPEEIGQELKVMKQMGKRSAIVVLSELIYPDLKSLTKTVQDISGYETKSMSLDHTQRGGYPTAMEKIFTSQMSMKAVELLMENKSGLAIGILQGEVKGTPILEALDLPRTDRKMEAIKINSILKEK